MDFPRFLRSRYLPLAILAFLLVSIGLIRVAVQQRQETRKAAQQTMQIALRGQFTSNEFFVKFTPGVAEQMRVQVQTDNSATVPHIDSQLDSTNQQLSIVSITPLFQTPLPGSIQELQQRQAMPEGTSNDLNQWFRVRLTGQKKVITGQSADSTSLTQLMQTYQADPTVEAVEPNYIYHTTIVPNDTTYPQMWNLPKLQMDKAWDISTGSSQVKVAVLDTGVDYTHPELGATQITERPFSAATPPLNLFSDVSTDQIFSMDANRLVYTSGNKIYLYSFSADPGTPILTLENGFDYVVKIALKANMIVYQAVDNNLTKSALFLYNLATHEQRKIADTVVVVGDYPVAFAGSIAIAANGKVAYERTIRNSEGVASSNIFLYDIVSGIETEIGIPLKTLSPVASGNLVIYPVVDNFSCYEKATIYDTTTRGQRDIFPPDIGPILDFKGNKILYAACSKTNFDSMWRTYYLYDIVNGETKRLVFDTTTGLDGSIRPQGGLFTVSWFIKGAITDNVIYFSKNQNGNRIIGYDLNQNRYVQVNLLKRSGAIDADGDRVCFASVDLQIHCHTYNPSYAYPPLGNVFNSRVVGGYDFTERDTDPFDGFGHGTHVSGTIGAFTNNGQGISGINWDVSLLEVKVLDDYGYGTTATIAQGITYAANTGSNVINMSLGGNSACGLLEQNAIDYAYSREVSVVVAAGNDNRDAQQTSPASCNHVIAVGALGPDDTRAYYSNYGNVVSIAAPGGDVYKCTDIGRFTCLIYSTIPGGYSLYQGTSMAAPHVAGVIALMLAKQPQLNPDQIKAILMASSDHLTTDQPIGGKVNAYRALIAPVPTLTAGPSVTPAFTPTPISTPSATPIPTTIIVPSTTPTLTPTPTRIPNPTPTPTQVPVTQCSPRPPVQLATVSSSPGVLNVTMTLTANSGFSNILQNITITSVSNGTVTFPNGQQGGNGLVYTPSSATTQLTFTITRQTAGQATTVSFIVNDSCGSWPTFVGGGPNAF